MKTNCNSDCQLKNGAISAIYLVTPTFFGLTANQLIDNVLREINLFRIKNFCDPEFILMNPDQVKFLAKNYNENIKTKKPIKRVTNPHIFGIKVYRTKDLKETKIILK